jgi:hypothetical protein
MQRSHRPLPSDLDPCGRLADKIRAVWPTTFGLGAQIVALFV